MEVVLRCETGLLNNDIDGQITAVVPKLPSRGDQGIRGYFPEDSCAHINNDYFEFDIHGFVHQNTDLIKMTNKMQLCGMIYYSIVPWLLYMF